MMRLGRAIAIIRAAEGRTQAETALAIGVSPQVLSRLETGKGCEAVSLVKILAWLCSTPLTETQTALLEPPADEPEPSTDEAAA
jgi:transcriptional regulator with XRE-family HTH domain